MVPQGEIITGLATNLSAGTNHHVEVRAAAGTCYYAGNAP
jgi:hypothetical protein